MNSPKKVEFEKHWPCLVEGRLPTAQFLNSCQVILQFLVILGSMFVPVKKDLEGNLNKLNAKYIKDPKKYDTLHALLTLDPAHRPCAVDALRWLKRGLHLVYLLLDNFVESYEKSINESLYDSCLKAYEISLKSYHSWVVQKFAVACIRTVCPSREAFWKSIRRGYEGSSDEEIFKQLKQFVEGLEYNLQHIFSLYVEFGFDTVSVLK